MPGAVRMRRGFNCPTGLDGAERVWIVVEELPAGGTARFNGELLGRLLPGVANEFDVTAWLAPRNEVCLELQINDGGAAPVTDPEGVRIEIRCN